MRFGLNTFLLRTGFTDADCDLVDCFKGYGADVIELAIVEPHLVSPARVSSALTCAGLERPILCGAFGEGRDLRGNYNEVEAAKAYICELIELASDLGARVVCGPFYSRTGRTSQHSREERKTQSKAIVRSLKSLCAQAEAAGIVLAMEPLNRFETDCINTLDQAVELIERVDSPALKIHMDTFHMHIEERDSVAAIYKHAEHIAHVHASASHRGLLGQDQVNWQAVLAALDAIGYDGDIVIESFSPENQVIARAASIWRELYESPEQLAVEGLAFLRANWSLVRSTYGLNV